MAYRYMPTELKEFVVTIDDWQGRSEMDGILAYTHTEACTLCRQDLYLNGRTRQDGPLKLRARVRYPKKGRY